MGDRVNSSAFRAMAEVFLNEGNTFDVQVTMRDEEGEQMGEKITARSVDLGVITRIYPALNVKQREKMDVVLNTVQSVVTAKRTANAAELAAKEAEGVAKRARRVADEAKTQSDDEEMRNFKKDSSTAASSEPASSEPAPALFDKLKSMAGVTK